MHTFCTTPEDNVLQCDLEERNLGLKLQKVFKFTTLGIEHSRTVQEKNVTTKKYYKVFSFKNGNSKQ